MRSFRRRGNCPCEPSAHGKLPEPTWPSCSRDSSRASRPKAPGPQPAAILLVARLIDIEPRLGRQVLQQFLIGSLQRLANRAEDLGQWPTRDGLLHHAWLRPILVPVARAASHTEATLLSATDMAS